MNAVNKWFFEKNVLPAKLETHDDLFIPLRLVKANGATTAFVYAYLCWFRWYRNVEVTKDKTTYSFIAEKLGLTYSTVYSAVLGMESMGLLAKKGNEIAFLDPSGKKVDPDTLPGPFLKISREIAAYPKKDLGVDGKVILALALGNLENNQCRLGLVRISEMLNLSLATVQKWVSRLVSLGICARIKNHKLVILDFGNGK